MFEPLGNPSFLSAPERGKTRSSLSELLIFFVVIIVGQFARNLVMLPYTMARLMAEEGYYAVALEGNLDAATAFVTEFFLQMERSDVWYHVMMAVSTVALGGAALLVCLAVRKGSAASMALGGKKLLPMLSGMALGALAVAGALGFGMLFGVFRFESVTESLSAALIGMIPALAVQAFSYALLFQGYLMTTLARKGSLWVALAVSGVAFATFTASPAGGAFAFLNTALLGVLLSLYTVRSGNLYGSVAFHFAYLYGMGVLCGFPISGLRFPAPLLSFTVAVTDEYVGGGANGLENGMALTCVLALGIAVLAMRKTKEQNSTKL